MSSFLTRRALRTAAPLSRTFTSSAPRSSFAKMTIVGRLAGTPELQATSTGKEVLKYTVATSSGPRDNLKTNWFRVAAFLPEGPQRDFISALDKGYVHLYNFSCGEDIYGAQEERILNLAVACGNTAKSDISELSSTLKEMPRSP